MAPMGGRLAFRPDERRKVAEVIGDMDAEHRSGREESRPTIYSVVARLHAIRNHPIARRKRSYLEPLVEMILDERVKERLSNAENIDPNSASGEPAVSATEAVSTSAEQDTADTSAIAMDLSTTAADTEAARSEASPGRVRKQTRPKDGRRLRKRKRARSESDSGSDHEHRERRDGGDSGGKAVVPTVIPANGPKISDISGMNDVIQKLINFVCVPLQPGFYSNQSVLLYGPSGCGKTLVANAIAAETKAQFFAVSGPEIIGGVSGESEGNIRNIFEAAIRMAPSLIFLDDIEAIAGKQEQTAKGAMENRIALTLKKCMDRLQWETEAGKNVVVLAATSDANNLNPLVRQRFDIEVAVSVPSQDAREQILQKMTQDMALADDVDLKEIARMTPGFVGSDLKNVAKTASQLEMERVFNDKIARLQTVDGAATDDGLFWGSAEHVRLMHAVVAAEQPAGETKVAEPRIPARSFRQATQQVVPAAKREGFSTIPNTTWEQVGAMEAVREQLEISIIWPIRYPDRYAAVGLEAVGGILLWGPPGCGKTLVAKAVANESKANFISIRGPELLNKYVGESERALRELFERARAMTPCVIFFDEMDALAAKRDDGRSDGSARIVNTLLTELDGLVDRSGIYVIGATNRPDIIDPAIKRPGRLGESIFVGPPTSDDRVSILQTLCRNAALPPPPADTPMAGSDEVEAARARAAADNQRLLAAVARDRRCNGFSGADLDLLRRNAATNCLKRTIVSGEETHVSQDDWEAALAKVKPSISAAELERYKKMR
ncbi:aaa family ATPase rvb2 [Grosmannia clavigera kw1407]|uniref:Aaa family ATPase rvb2 n=1 Tax=Grosmannia clavigera (strain kw1407 / UAMH 11150) TaxID=655863 RepID=F0XU10_GROCL|nr:aaa family ATPase rvb2 [Grosmannia clavigera kw1407]EFW98438.1 aaa family ATPase rvb2 [Grosmannia clavigera kw1407]